MEAAKKTRGFEVKNVHREQISDFAIEIEHAKPIEGSLQWWDWYVNRSAPDGWSPVAQGVSWRSLEEATACARAVIAATMMFESSDIGSGDVDGPS